MWACDEEEALVVVVAEGRAAGMGVCAWCRMGAGVNTKTNKPKPWAVLEAEERCDCQPG